MPRLSTPRIAATLSVIPLPGIVAGRTEHADQAGAGIGRAAHDLDRFAGAGVDAQNLKLVRLRMLFGGQHLRDSKRRQRLGGVRDVLHLETDAGQLVGDRFDRCIGVEMVLQPRRG